MMAHRDSVLASVFFFAESRRSLHGNGVASCFSRKKRVLGSKPDSSGLPEGLLGRPFDGRMRRRR
jgi:hypothetical protein